VTGVKKIYRFFQEIYFTKDIIKIQFPTKT